jgi:hypothetical protein
MMVQFLKCEITCSIIQRILLTSELYSFCQSSSWPPAGFLKGVIMLFPMYPLSPIQFFGFGAADSRLWYAEWLADFRLCAIMTHVGQGGHYRFEKTEAWWPIRGSCPGSRGIYPDAEVDDFFAIEPGGMMHVMACSKD